MIVGLIMFIIILLCWLGITLSKNNNIHFHNWTKWESYGSGWFFQRRRCRDCGIIEERRIK